MNRIEDLIDHGWQARRDGRHADAERDLLEAIAASRRSGSRVQLIRALTGLAHAVRDAGDDERALRLYEEAVILGAGTRETPPCWRTPFGIWATSSD